MSLQTIARLKVTLDAVEPAVTRKIEVPSNIRLDRLHETLQAALGWTNSHLWELRADETGWGIPDPDWPDGPLDASSATLWEVVDDSGVMELIYLYDFGDGWEHTITIVEFDDADPNTKYPVLLEANGRCPPEDVGGPWGYAECLEAIDNPEHDRHEEMIEWWPDNFDPATAPVDDLKTCVADLATRWSRKPRAKKSA
jgi:Plasmid pRiA4b ORF-3-like protein